MHVHDLSNEIYREYAFINLEDKEEHIYKINYPQSLHISDTGSHRIVDFDGIVHYIRNEWIAIRWKPFDVNAPVQF